MKKLAVLAILTANVVGGMSYLWQKLAMRGLPPATIILGRNITALLCLGIFLKWRGGIRWPRERSANVRLAIIGILAFAAPLLLGILGVKWSTSSNASILVLLEPASILVLSWLFLKERLRGVQIFGICLGFAGALAIVLEDAPASGLFSGTHFKGNLLLAVHSALWGLYTPIMKPLTARYRVSDLSFVSMVYAMVLLVPASLPEIGTWESGPYLFDALFWMAWMGIVVSCGVVLLWNWSLKFLPASTIAPFIFFQPLAGILAGHLVLNERLTSAAIAGSGLIAAGVVLVVALPRRSAVSD